MDDEKKIEMDEEVRKAITEEVERIKAEMVAENQVPTVKDESEVAGVNPYSYKQVGVGEAIFDVKEKVIKEAVEKINDEKIINKHSDKIAEISDQALEVEAEQQRLIVEKAKANNKVVKQEIKNQLIILRAEAKRLRMEQKQIDKDLRAKHKKQNKEHLWEIYGDRLTKAHYDYVPNIFVLGMILVIDGVKSFFDGVGAISTSIVRAVKWALLIVAIVAVVMIIPITRNWILDLFQFI